MELMIFRIVYIGNTGCINELKAAAQEVNPTAHYTWLGLVCPDDCIEAKVSSIDEGKALMKHIYDKVNSFPKRYSWTEGDSFYNGSFTKYIGHDVCSDRYEADGSEQEHFEDFLED
jgi:hypothetical protein